MTAVSVVLPVYNAANTLSECLESTLSQSFNDFELVIINDQSTDGSSQLLDRHSRQDHRIRVIHNPEKGLVNALNLGLKEAQSPLIARMDADDLMHPERLKKQWTYLQHNRKTTLVGCATNPFPNHLLSDGFRHYIQWQNSCNSPQQIAHEIYLESPFAHPGVMFRKREIEALGGYRQGPFPEDYDLWLRLHHAGHQMAKLPDRLLEWRDYPERTSRTDPRCSREAFDQLRAEYLSRDPRLLTRRENFVVWGAGRNTRKRCAHLLQKGFTPRVWIDIDPKKIGNTINGVTVVSPEWLINHPDHLVLIYVANHGARELIAGDLQKMGRTSNDYLMVG
ncbi:MAG: glycosyltransferase [Gammaproteobacteria bacterium]|nr:glycosyltransferase [Gammaproteobacteria bacterium]